MADGAVKEVPPLTFSFNRIQTGDKKNVQFSSSGKLGVKIVFALRPFLWLFMWLKLRVFTWD